MSDHDLFKKYLEICNTALRANKDRFPYKQVLGAAQNSQKGRTIAVNIVDDTPQESYIIKLQNDRISGNSENLANQDTCDGKWNIRKSYLEMVVNDPDAYIKNPAKIDWEWMYDIDVAE